MQSRNEILDGIHIECLTNDADREMNINDKLNLLPMADMEYRLNFAIRRLIVHTIPCNVSHAQEYSQDTN